MKRWLMIIVLVMTAAMALADGENRSSSERTVLPTAVLTQNDGGVPAEDTTPLLAIPGRIPMHLCGSGHAPVKGNRPSGENPVSGIHSHTISLHMSALKAGTAIFPIFRVYVRSADGYIYFLRRIII